MDVSSETPDVTTKPKCYDFTNILVWTPPLFSDARRSHPSNEPAHHSGHNAQAARGNRLANNTAMDRGITPSRRGATASPTQPAQPRPGVGRPSWSVRQEVDLREAWGGGPRGEREREREREREV